MSVLVYLSNLSGRWTFERQEAEHAAHTPGWPDVATFRDKLSARARMAHRPERLKERAALLRPSSRDQGEIICVASPAVLAVGATDFLEVCAAAAKRNATIVAHETGMRIEPGAGAEELNAAVAVFLEARRRSDNIGDRWRPGAEASAAARAADLQARIDKIRPIWGNLSIPLEDVLREGGRKVKGRREKVPMAYQTARNILGTRHEAARKAQTDIKREQKRREAVAKRKPAETGEDE